MDDPSPPGSKFHSHASQNGTPKGGKVGRQKGQMEVIAGRHRGEGCNFWRGYFHATYQKDVVQRHREIVMIRAKQGVFSNLRVRD